MFLEFTRERYIKVLLALFSLLFLYCLARVVLRGTVPRLNADGIKSAVVLYIMIYQGLRAAGIFQQISLVTLFLLVLACVMQVLHWPYAVPILIITFSCSFLCLLIDSLRSIRKKTTEFVLLSFPFMHAMYLLSENFFSSPVGLFWYLEMGLTFVLASYLAFSLFRKKERAT
jgi:hypothetical protein